MSRYPATIAGVFSLLLVGVVILAVHICTTDQVDPKISSNIASAQALVRIADALEEHNELHREEKP